MDKSENNRLFIKALAQQLLPYLLQQLEVSDETLVKENEGVTEL